MKREQCEASAPVRCFWRAVGSGAPHRFSSEKNYRAGEKRRRRFALPAQSKKARQKCPKPGGLFVVLLKRTKPQPKQNYEHTNKDQTQKWKEKRHASEHRLV
jgi:hypothetical protein